ncbi:MAG: hotdog fold thioesterase [Kofleriaceae bacterium]|nr:hotdog fold thioesterase [Kofleriaceae bacterium]
MPGPDAPTPPGSVPAASPDRTAQRAQWNRLFAENVPFNRALGLEILELSEAGALFRLPYHPQLVGNPETGVLHGGVITSLLDACSGSAVFAALPRLVPIATLDLRIDYLRPADPGQAVTARAHCYKVTRNVAFVRAHAFHADEADLIATAAGTFMIGTKLGTPAAPPAPAAAPPAGTETP